MAGNLEASVSTRKRIPISYSKTGIAEINQLHSCDKVGVTLSNLQARQSSVYEMSTLANNVAWDSIRQGLYVLDMILLKLHCYTL